MSPVRRAFGALALAVLPAAGLAQALELDRLAFHEKVALDADIRFPARQSSLGPAGRRTLDAFVVSIGGLESHPVFASGDSGQRVNAVKAYLVSKGVAASRIRMAAGASGAAAQSVLVEISGTRAAIAPEALSSFPTPSR